MMAGNWLGKTLGKVQIEAPLARGGVAEVYLGTHITLQRKVAVKILRNPGDDHSDALERFEREARVVASLRHPNIVQVYDFDTVDSDPYLVMEYIQGPSLSKYLYFLHQNNKRLDLPEIVKMIRGVASALQYAHNNGIVHRDIKPGNILLTSPTRQIEAGEPLPEDFEPVLTDFGLVRFIDSSRQTSTGVTAGTPAYMSPEQAQGDPADGRTDIYSLGIVLYEMLAGKLPFDGETTMSILLKHVTEPPQPIPGLSPFMQQVLDRALTKRPEDRYQTPQEFANAFSTAVDIQPATMQIENVVPMRSSPFGFHNAPTVLDTDNPKPLHKRTWVRAVLIGALALLGGGFLLINRLPRTSTEQPVPTSTTVTIQATTTGTSTATLTPTLLPVILEPSVVLRFQDGNAIADRAVVEAQRIPAPPSGNRYEVWLVNNKNNRKRISLGILNLDKDGMGSITFTDGNGANLAALYDQAEISIEPENDTQLSSSELVAYSYTLPADGLPNIRYLLAAYNNTPNKTALIQGMYPSIRKINELALGMQTAFEKGDETQVRRNAEAILNLIVGSQSPDYKDWDGDGSITDVSDGFGLTLNGSNAGYFQAVYMEADATVKSAGATEPMVKFGEYLKTSVQNLAQWTLQLQPLVQSVLENIDSQKISAVVALSKQMLNGVDLDNNGVVEPKVGESGAQYAYQFAYGMAEMPMANTGLFGTPTPGAGTIGGGGNNGGGATGGGTTVTQPTKKPPPGLDDKATKTPKP